MAVLSKLRLGSRNLIPSPTPTMTMTMTPTITPTPTPLPPLTITYQSPADQTRNTGESVVDVTVYSGGGSYTANWQVWNGCSAYVTVQTYSGTLGSGYTNFSGPGAIDATFYQSGIYTYNSDGGAGYYKFTITVSGNTVDTGFIRVYTRNAYECDCWCKYYGGGPQVGDYLCYGGETCTENCCEIDCSGDCTTGYGCRGECSQADFDYCANNYCPCSPTACGYSCSCGTYYYCTNGTYMCETCYGSTNNPQC